MLRLSKIMMLFFVLSSFGVVAQGQNETPYDIPINRCINLGNMLEAPSEGAWGVRVEEEYINLIAEAGFDSVRIPISWSTNSDIFEPFTIDDDFIERIHEVVGWVLDADLKAIINVHHFEDMMETPYEDFGRLNSYWSQIAESFAGYSNETVLFELLNEPNNQLNAEIWNDLYPDLVRTIRETNPNRFIIIGGDEWNSAAALNRLELTRNTRNLIFTFHFYDPFEYTHQGAEWVDGANEWLGTAFGSGADYAQIHTTFDEVVAWSRRNQVPVFLGEFGAYSTSDMAMRAEYTQAVRVAAEERNIAWCYWEFAAGFGIYDPNTEEFNALYPELIPETPLFAGE